jgi:hypothetical protein
MHRGPEKNERLLGASDRGQERARGTRRLSSFEPMATILGGAFDAAALAIATSEQPKSARAQVSEALDMLIDGLQARAKPSQKGEKASRPRRHS